MITIIDARTIKIIAQLLSAALILSACASGGCDKKTPLEKGAMEPVKTYYIGRFSIDVPAIMVQKYQSAKLGYVEIKEITWSRDKTPEQARTAEWEKFMAKVKEIKPPKGKDNAVIRIHDFPKIGKWAKGVFYYTDKVDNEYAPWALLIDVGQSGLWLKSDRTEVEDENATNRMSNNLISIAKSYQPLDVKTLKVQTPDNQFYLRNGLINLPYSEQEESKSRFESHPLDFSISIKMEMDFSHGIEKKGLIEKTEKFMSSKIIPSTVKINKIRLQKREVAGMPGEEAALEGGEGKERELTFRWEYNGKYDSGEYPRTSIEFQCPSADNLEEKLKIWDAVLDSMKPLFDRKK